MFLSDTIQCHGETHDAVLCSFINLMKLPNELPRGKEQWSTSIIRKKQNEMHVSAMSLEKTAFDMSGIEP